MAAWLFLAVSIVGAGFTLSALVRARRLGVLVVPYFFGAWLTAELAMHHLVWQALATVVFVACGALHHWPGLLGLAVTLSSWLGLIVLQQRSAGAAEGFEHALREGLGDTYRPAIPPEFAGTLP